MRSLTSPLQDEIRQLEAEEEHIKREYKIVEGRITSTEASAISFPYFHAFTRVSESHACGIPCCAVLQEKIIMWEDERVKLLAWGRKEYDTDKLTGTVQRYPSLACFASTSCCCALSSSCFRLLY
jgi:hypothetical protein